MFPKWGRCLAVGHPPNVNCQIKTLLIGSNLRQPDYEDANIQKMAVHFEEKKRERKEIQQLQF